MGKKNTETQVKSSSWEIASQERRIAHFYLYVYRTRVSPTGKSSWRWRLSDSAENSDVAEGGGETMVGAMQCAEDAIKAHLEPQVHAYKILMEWGNSDGIEHD